MYKYRYFIDNIKKIKNNIKDKIYKILNFDTKYNIEIDDTFFLNYNISLNLSPYIDIKYILLVYI